MAASRARLEALLARVQKRASEPRGPSAAMPPMLEAVKGGASRSSADEAPASVRTTSGRIVSASATSPGVGAQSMAAQNAAPQSSSARDVISHGARPQNEVADDDIEEYDEELIEIIDDAEVIPQAVAVARAIEPAAFGAAVERRPSAPIRSEPARPASARSSEPARREAPRPEALRPEAVAPRPIAASEIARARSPRRELRHSTFVELLDASLELG